MREGLRSFLVGIVAGALLVGAPHARAEDVANGSFEDAETDSDNAYGDLAAHWGRWGGWMNRESIWKPTHKGKCLMGYHHWQIESDDTSGIYQDIANAPAGAEFTFSVYASKDAGTNAEGIELRIEKVNGGEAVASQLFPVDQIKSSSWTKLSVTGTNPAEGLRVLVIVKPKPDGVRKGSLKFDDASLSVGGAGVAASEKGAVSNRATKKNAS